MKVTFNMRSGIGPLTLDLDLDEASIFSQVKEAINQGTVLDLTDSKGDRVLIPGQMIGYVQVPVETAHRVGFGRL